MNRHTPGPWTPTWTHPTRCAVHCGAWMSQGIVAVVQAAGNDQDFSKETAEKNATLIAAAPELLSALEYIEQFCGAPMTKEQMATLRKKALAAIAKAKGETS